MSQPLAHAVLFLLQVGVDLDRAGTVSWVSSPLMPAPWTNQNIINNWDQVRPSLWVGGCTAVCHSAQHGGHACWHGACVVVRQGVHQGWQ